MALYEDQDYEIGSDDEDFPVETQPATPDTPDTPDTPATPPRFPSLSGDPARVQSNYDRIVKYAERAERFELAQKAKAHNAAARRHSAATGARYFRDESGMAQPVIDDVTGLQRHTPRISPVRKDSRGRPYQVKTDETGRSDIVDPDANAKWEENKDDPEDTHIYKVSVTGERAKYNPEEGIMSGDRRLAEESARVLHKRELEKIKNEQADISLRLQDPTRRKKMTESQRQELISRRDELAQEIPRPEPVTGLFGWGGVNAEKTARQEAEWMALESDRKAQLADLDSAIADDDERRRMEQRSYDLAVRQKALRDVGGVSGILRMRRREAGERVVAMTPEQVTAHVEQRAKEIDALDSDLSARGTDLERRHAELEAAMKGGYTIDKIGEIDRRRAELKADAEALTADVTRRNLLVEQLNTGLKEREAKEKAEHKAQVEKQRAPLRENPATAKFAAELDALDAEAEQRIEAVRAMPEGNDKRAAMAALNEDLQNRQREIIETNQAEIKAQADKRAELRDQAESLIKLEDKANSGGFSSSGTFAAEVRNQQAAAASKQLKENPPSAEVKKAADTLREENRIKSEAFKSGKGYVKLPSGEFVLNPEVMSPEWRRKGMMGWEGQLKHAEEAGDLTSAQRAIWEKNIAEQEEEARNIAAGAILDNTTFQKWLRDNKPKLYKEGTVQDNPAIREAAVEFLESEPTLASKVWDKVGRFWEGAFQQPAAGLATAFGVLSQTLFGWSSNKQIEDNLFYQLGQGTEEAMRMQRDVRMDESGWSQFSTGVGSAAGFILPTAGVGMVAKAGRAAKLMKLAKAANLGKAEKAAEFARIMGGSEKALRRITTASVMTQGALQNGAQLYKEARDAGLDHNHALLPFVLGGVVGLSEAIPISKWIERLGRPKASSAWRIVTNMLTETAEESLQEGGQQLSSNAVAKMIYDKNRHLLEGVGGGALAGGEVGAVIALLTSSVGNIRARRYKKRTGLEPQQEGDQREIDSPAIEMLRQGRQIQLAVKQKEGTELTKDETIEAAFLDSQPTSQQLSEFYGYKIKADTTKPLPEAMAAANAQIDAWQPPEALTAANANIERTAARAALKILSGKSVATLVAAERLALTRKMPDGTPRMEIVQGKPVITDGQLRRLATVAPATAEMPFLPEGVVRQQILNLVSQESSEPSTESVSQDPTPEGPQPQQKDIDQSGDKEASSLLPLPVGKAGALVTPKERQAAEQIEQRLTARGVGVVLAKGFARYYVRREGTDQWTPDRADDAAAEFERAGGHENPKAIREAITASDNSQKEGIEEIHRAVIEGFGEAYTTLPEEARKKVDAIILHRIAPELLMYRGAFQKIVGNSEALGGGGVGVGKGDGKGVSFLVNLGDLLNKSNAEAWKDDVVAERTVNEEVGHSANVIALAQARAERTGETGDVLTMAMQEAAEIWGWLPKQVQSHVHKIYGKKGADLSGMEFFRMLLQNDIALADGKFVTADGKIFTEQATPTLIAKLKDVFRNLIRVFSKLETRLRKEFAAQGLSKEESSTRLRHVRKVRSESVKIFRGFQKTDDETRVAAYGKEYGDSRSTSAKDAGRGTHNVEAGVRAPATATDQGAGGEGGGEQGRSSSGSRQGASGLAHRGDGQGSRSEAANQGSLVEQAGVSDVSDELGGDTGTNRTLAQAEKEIEALEQDKAERIARAERIAERRGEAVKRQAQAQASKEDILKRVPEAARALAARVLEKVHMGAASYVLGANRERLPAVYIAAAPDTVQTSHRGESFEKNPLYGGKNTRSYHSDKTEQNKVLEITKPGALDEDAIVTDSKSAADGPAQVVLAVFNDASGNLRVSLQTAGGNGREQGINLAPLEDQERLTQAWKDRSGGFGLEGMPEGWRGYRFLGVFDLRDEAQRHDYQKLVDKLNPSQGVVQDTAERAHIDADLNIPVERLLDVPLDLSPKAAQEFMTDLVRDAEKLGLDRNLVSGLVNNPGQAQFYIQRLLVSAAFRSKTLGELFASAQWTSGHAIVSGLIKSAVATALQLRSKGQGGIADAIGTTLERIAERVKAGRKITLAIRDAAEQMDMAEDGPVVQQIAGAIARKVAFYPQNKRGIVSVDTEETLAGFDDFFADMARAIGHFSAEPDLLGESRTIAETITAGIEAHFRKSAVSQADSSPKQVEARAKHEVRLWGEDFPDIEAQTNGRILEAHYAAMRDALKAWEELTGPQQENLLRVASAQKQQVREQYEGTEQWMKGPNGKDTKLTEDQWLTVRTPLFKRWFGDWEVLRKQSTQGTAWAADFPNIIPMSTGRAVTSHADHQAAKAGDRDAAARLVMDLAKPDRLREIASRHPSAIVVPVHAEEASGRNRIPSKFADYFGHITGLEVDEGIVQAGKVERTGKGLWYRMAFRPRFEGRVQEGREYILVDDVVTGGGSLSELRQYIESRGGKVVAISTLGYAKFSTKIALSEKTRLALVDKFGETALREFLASENLYGGEIGALTESEARALLNVGSLDAARDRIFEAGQDRLREAQPGVFSEARPPSRAQVLEARGIVNPDSVSKAIDPETGEPMVFYRGDRSPDFDVFDRRMTKERGFFFTNIKEVAAGYAGSRDPRAFFLNAKNLLDLSEDTAPARKFIAEWGQRFEDWTDRESGEEVDPASAVFGGRLFDWEGDGSSERWRDIQATAEAKGYDGVILPDWDNGLGVFPAYVIYSSHQIKSAIGNNGAFTGSDSILQAAPKLVDPRRIETYVQEGGAPRNNAVRTDSERISRTLAQHAAREVAGTGGPYQQGELFAPQGGTSLGSHLARQARAALSAIPPERDPAARRVSDDLRKGLAGDWDALARAIDGKGRASSIFADLVHRRIPSWDVVGTRIEGPADVAALMQPIRSPYFESVKVMVLDGNDTVIHSQIVHVGSLNESIADPKAIFASLVALREKTGREYRRIILSHNHPSGNPEPSEADRALTRRLTGLAKMVGFDVADHVITNGETWFSFREMGLVSYPELTGRKREFKPRKQGEPSPKFIPGTLAPWEAVPRQSLALLDRTDLAAEAARRLRNAAPDAVHVLYLSTRLSLTAVERLTAEEFQDQRTRNQKIFAGVAREGAHSIILDMPNDSARPFLQELKDLADAGNFKLTDVVYGPEMKSIRLSEQAAPFRAAEAAADGEKHVARRFHENLPLAMSIASKFTNIPGVTANELRQQARLALADAARNFDAARGKPFAAMAGVYVRNRLRSLYRSETTRAARFPMSLNDPLSEGSLETHGDYAEDTRTPSAVDAAAARETRRMLDAAIASLPEPMQKAVRGFYEERTLEEIGRELGGVSKQRVAVLQQAAFRRLQGKLGEQGVTAPEQILARGAADDMKQAMPDADQAGQSAQPASNEASQEAVADAFPERQATTLQEARTAANAFVGEPITNRDDGLVASLSRNTLDKMLSDSAVKKSISPEIHAVSVANLDALFRNAVKGFFGKDTQGDPNIEAVHRYFAPLVVGRNIYVAKLTVKEFKRASEGSRLYSVESLTVDMGKPARNWVASISENRRNYTPQAGFEGKLLAKLENVNRELVHPEAREPGDGSRQVLARSAQESKGARPTDPLYSPTGHLDWSTFVRWDVEQSKGRIKALPIRMLRGEDFGANRGFGLEHAMAEHAKDFEKFSGTPEQFIHRVLLDFNEVYADGGRLLLLASRPKSVAVVELREEAGGFYSVVTAFPKENPAWKPRGERILDGRRAAFAQSERAPGLTAQERQSPKLPREPLPGKDSWEYFASLRKNVNRELVHPETREQVEKQTLLARIAEALLTPPFRKAMENDAVKGYPGLEGLTPSKGLTREERVMEAHFAQIIAANPVGFAERYRILAEQETGHDGYVNADMARDLYGPYRNNKEMRAFLEKATIAPAGYVAQNLAWKNALRRSEVDPRSEAVFVVGGMASGKSTRAVMTPGVQKGAAVIYDSVLGNYERAKIAIQQALDAGLFPRVFFIWRPFSSAVEGMLGRLVSEGRPVSVRSMAEGHFNAQQVFLRLADEFSEDERLGFDVLKNFYPGDARMVSVDELRAASYSNSDGKSGSRETQAQGQKDPAAVGTGDWRSAGDGQLGGQESSGRTPAENPLNLSGTEAERKAQMAAFAARKVQAAYDSGKITAAQALAALYGSSTAQAEATPQILARSVEEEGGSVIDDLLRDLDAEIDDWQQAALAEEAAGGWKTVGRPDLAHGADNADVRGVDQFYTNEFEPETEEAWESEALAMVERDFDGTRKAIQEAGLVGRLLSASQIKAADIIAGELRRRMLASGEAADRTAFNLFWYSRRAAGSEWGRAGRAMRDSLKTPTERHREYLLDYMTKPRKKAQKEIDDAPSETEHKARIKELETQLFEATRQRDAERVKRIKAELALERVKKTKEFLIDKETADLLDKLKAAGITPQDVLQERVALSLHEKSILKEFEQLLARNKSSDARRMAFAFIRRNRPFEEIAKKTGLPEAEVRKIKSDFVAKMRTDHYRKFLTGARADAPSVVTGRRVEQAEAEKEFSKWLKKLGFVEDAEQGRPKFSIEDPAHTVRMIRAVQAARGDTTLGDMVYEGWIMSILSGIKTHVANITGNTTAGVLDMTLQRGLEALINLAVQDPKAARFGEFKYLLSGLLPGITKGITMGAKAWSAEHDFFESTVLGTPLELDRADKLGGTRASIPGATGRTIRIPGRGLLFMDSLYKTSFAQMEVGAQAYRIAKSEGLSGLALERRVAMLMKTRGEILSEYLGKTKPTKAAAEHFARRLARMDSTLDVDELVADRTSEAWERAHEQAAYDAAKRDGWKDDAWQAAVKKARELTFQQDLLKAKKGGNVVEDLAAKLQDARNDNKLAGIHFPFVRTPYNIFRVGLRKSPLGTLNLVNQLRKGLWNMKNGKPYLAAHPELVRDLAEQTIAWVTMALLWGAAQGDDDDDDKLFLITGSMPRTLVSRGERDLNTRATGGDFVIRIGGRNGIYINYGRIEPIAVVLGVTVDIIRGIKRQGTPRENMAQVWNYMVASVNSKSFLHGLANISALMEGRDDLVGQAKRMALQALVPNLIRQPLRSLDDYVRDGKLAGLEYELFPTGAFAEPKINPYGEAIRKEGNPALRLFFDSPLQANPTLQQTDKALLRWNRNNPNDAWAPQEAETTYKNRRGEWVQMTAEEARTYRTIAGRRAVAKLRGIVTPTVVARPTEQDVKRIKNAFADARREARKTLFGFN